MTDNDIYKPSKTELRLLKELLNPESATLNIKDLCEKAGVSRNFYYEATARDGFNSLVKSTALELIKGKAGYLIDATYKYAMQEKGHRDRKLLLEMIGAYTDKIEHSGNIGLDLEVKWGDENEDND